MTDSDPRKNIQELASSLIEKKSKGQRINLFLGHRTGALFTNNLYTVLNNYCKTPEQLHRHIKGEIAETNKPMHYFQSMQVIAKASVIQKNSQIYKFLGKYFNELAIYTLLQDAINLSYSHSDGTQEPVSVENDLLAELIRAGFFETIITTNIDSRLEQSLERRGLKTPDDYQVIIVSEKHNETFKPKDEETLIIKIFGDLASLEYKTVGDEFILGTENENKPFRMFLKTYSEKDLIILGYDVLWDWPLERMFDKSGGAVWYGNEEPLENNSHLSYIFDQRDAKYIVGPAGKYSSFLETLYNHIGGEASLSPSPLSRKNVFISYAHKDKKHLEHLHMHLKGRSSLKDGKEDRLDIWDDTKIDVGKDWYKEICDALAKAKIAVLLVSAEFMASDFIRQYELPPLLQAARNQEVLLVPVILSECAFLDSELAKYQVMYTAKPLLSMQKNKREEAWSNIAKYIDENLNKQT